MITRTIRIADGREVELTPSGALNIVDATGKARRFNEAETLAIYSMLVSYFAEGAHA